MIRELQVIERELKQKDITLMRKDFTILGNDLVRDTRNYLNEVSRTTKRKEKQHNTHKHIKMNPFTLLSKQQKRIRKPNARTLKEFRNEEKVFNPKREMQDYLLVTIDDVGVLIPNDMKMEFDDAKKIIQKQIKRLKK